MNHRRIHGPEPGANPRYRSTLLFHLTQRLLYTRWRDPGDRHKLHLFSQPKRITAAIIRAGQGKRPIKGVLDPYNPTGSTVHVNFTTSKTERYETDSRDAGSTG